MAKYPLFPLGGPVVGVVNGPDMVTVPIAMLEALLRSVGGTVVLDDLDMIRDSKCSVTVAEGADPHRWIFRLEEKE